MDAAQASYDAAKADLDRAEQGAAGPEYEDAKAKVNAASEALAAAKATQSQREDELAAAE